MDNPCFNCPERSVGCHAKCERRAEWIERHLEEKNKARQAKGREAMLNDHVIMSKEKARRNHRNRRNR